VFRRLGPKQSLQGRRRSLGPQQEVEERKVDHREGEAAGPAR